MHRSETDWINETDRWTWDDRVEGAQGVPQRCHTPSEKTLGYWIYVVGLVLVSAVFVIALTEGVASAG